MVVVGRDRNEPTGIWGMGEEDEAEAKRQGWNEQTNNTQRQQIFDEL